MDGGGDMVVPGGGLAATGTSGWLPATWPRRMEGKEEDLSGI